MLLCLGASAPAPHRTGTAQTPRQAPITPITFESVSRFEIPAQAPSGLPSDLARTLPQITPWQKATVHRGDSLAGIFAHFDIAAAQWRSILALGGKADALRVLHPDDVIELRETPHGDLAELRYSLDDHETLIINRRSDGFYAEVRRLDVRKERVTVRGVVGRSLPRSLARAGLPSDVANQLAEIFRYRAELSKHMHRGDAFRVMYDRQYVDGRKIADGPIIAASIANDGDPLMAFRAVRRNGIVGYYDADGRSYKPAFTRHPVAYTRISSTFSLSRMNPVLHIRRPHYGVDMAAPIGTPIHAAADGVVRFVGRETGYGKLVELRHFKGYSTRYAHMHRFVHGLHDGEHVSEGQVIGYVGETGIATGPHLHFEIRKNGVAHDPLKIKLPNDKPLPSSRLAAFSRRITPLIAQLDRVPNTLLASTTPPAGESSTGCGRKSLSINVAFALDPNATRSAPMLPRIFCMVDNKVATNA